MQTNFQYNSFYCKGTSMYYVITKGVGGLESGSF
jgi:hypothetical protein